MHLLPSQLDVEGVGGVPSTGQRHTQLGGGDTQHLLGRLAKLGAQGFTGDACTGEKSRMGWGGVGYKFYRMRDSTCASWLCSHMVSSLVLIMQPVTISSYSTPRLKTAI